MNRTTTHEGLHYYIEDPAPEGSPTKGVTNTTTESGLYSDIFEVILLGPSVAIAGFTEDPGDPRHGLRCFSLDARDD
jgi:hypothetical protein